MNYYPEQLDVINVYIKHLNAAEKEIVEMDGDVKPYPKTIPLFYDDDSFGILHDEIGGAWSWSPWFSQPSM